MSCRHYCLIVLVFFCLWTDVRSQEKATFSRRVVGYVKDREGHPVVNAKVCGQPHGPWTGPIPCGESKSDGAFYIDFWHPGTYTISAENKAAGFPDAANSFYGKFFGELPVITVNETSELKPVEVRIGPKAGRLIFKIVDDESGQIIKSGLVKVCRTDNSRMCWSTGTGFPNGRYELLAPEVPFTIRFELWGSGNEWEEQLAIEEAGGKIEVLMIDLGARKKITVRLRRIRDER